MKKFKYRVESYLKYLIFNREEALRELKKAETYRNNLLDKYSQMEKQMKEAFETNSQLGKGDVDIHMANDNNQFIEMLKIHMKNLSLEIAEAEQEYQNKYKALLELQMKVKKMELHKEMEHEKYMKEYKKKSQKMTDEINNTRQRGKDAESL